MPKRDNFKATLRYVSETVLRHFRYWSRFGFHRHIVATIDFPNHPECPGGADRRNLLIILPSLPDRKCPVSAPAPAEDETTSVPRKDEDVSKRPKNKRLARILDAAEAHFGDPVARVTAPGGEGRSSYRLHFKQRDVIATLRPNFRRTHLEAYVLDALSQHCDDTPKNLGVVGEIMFQSDVGARRLNQEIVNHDQGQQIEMTAEAVEGIFRIQAAARHTNLHDILPHLGTNDEWTRNFVNAADALRPFAAGSGTTLDRTAACEAIASPGLQFVKWDCRSGNAAIGGDDKIRWFDFEYSGLRHGAEDFAWLIGDEAWPLSPEIMETIIEDCFDPGCGYGFDDYMNYLSIYLTFHCIQRFKLITKESDKRGWLSKERVRKFDDAGLHPDFAAQICEVGRHFAARTKLTAPLAQSFENARAEFQALAQEGSIELRSA